MEASREGGNSSRTALVIPVYNGQEPLVKTLESVRRCTVVPDVVVVDDGSDPPITAPSGQGPRALLRLEENRGIEHALNRGLEFVLGGAYEYVARLDAGDEVLPDRFEEQIRFLDGHPEYGIVGSHVEYFAPSGETLFTYRLPTSDSAIRRYFRYNSPFVHASVMMRVSALRKVGQYRDTFEAAEDYDLFWRISRSYKAANLDRVLTRAENNPSGIRFRRRRQQIISRIRIKTGHFNGRDPHSYVGLAKDLVLLVVPSRVSQGVKALLWK